MGIKEMAEEGLSLVENDPRHDLKAGFRSRLLSYFDEMSGAIGRRRRTSLAILTVEKVLPLWASVFPENDTPRRALDLAANLVTGVISSAVAQSEMGRFWTYCDDLSWRHADKQNAIMVCYGACQAIREALSEKHFGSEGLNDDSTDMDVDPYDHDSCFCAMIAYSGGPSWNRRSDPQKRLEFWTWWLTSAVGEAIVEQ
jgi:hypothetical protein